MIRLDKMLAHSGYGTRKEVKELIRKGFVTVNGEVIVDDDYKVNEEVDEVIIVNETVNYEELIYIMLNKPDGYVSATFDNNLPTVLDLINEYQNRNLFPVGRLDIDTVGLLLITNDGKLAHKMLSPKNHVDKTYYLKYSGSLNDNQIKKLESGVTLDDGYLTKPAKVKLLDDNQMELTITEGKYHQVKRMLEAVGSRVTYLKRISFGPLSLDCNLEEGKYRYLTKEEIELLKKE